jgi:GABA(A) receptor-associated protein
MHYSFSRQFSLFDRLKEATRIMKQHPDRVPIICERNNSAGDCPEIDKKKYLVPRDLTVGQFIFVLRKRMNLHNQKAIFLFINGGIPSTSRYLGDLHDYYMSNDRFLYIKYSFENTFG